MARPKEADFQELDAIASYHEDATTSLTRYFADWENIDNVRYIGLTRTEISLVLQDRLSETELRSILQLLASLEAALRMDYSSRCKNKAKDDLSRALRNLYKKKGEHVRLDEDILEAWLQYYPELKRVIGQIRSALHLRHWLAHGRYWRPRSRSSYQEIEGLVTAFFEGFPLAG